MNHPCAAFGVLPSRGRQLRPGKAGSALALACGTTAVGTHGQVQQLMYLSVNFRGD